MKNEKPIIASSVLGVLIFICTEVMLFTALISALFIVKTSYNTWPPLGQPRLPIGSTALNSLVLILSGFLLKKAFDSFSANQMPSAKKLLGISTVLGTIFIVVQGYEWVTLLSFGLTMTSSAYGSFFYLIIGFHALHAIAALLAMGIIYFKLRQDKLELSTFKATSIFWYFVVGLWPILYVFVYLLKK